MYSKRLGLGILITVAATMLAACDSPKAGVAAAVAPDAPNLAKNGNGNPHTTGTSDVISMTPSSVQLSVGGTAWVHVTLLDRAGNVVPEDGKTLLWYGCMRADLSDSCALDLIVDPVYPGLRDAKLTAKAAGVFTVSVDDGNGHRAYTTVTVQ